MPSQSADFAEVESVPSAQAWSIRWRMVSNYAASY